MKKAVPRFAPLATGLLFLACGPIADRAFGDPVSGTVSVIRDGRVFWTRDQLPLRQTLSFNKGDGFLALPPNDEIRVQAGSLIKPPPPRWDLLASVGDIESQSDEVFNNTIAIINEASDAENAWQSLLAIDDPVSNSSTYYPYSGYSPVQHSFDAKSSGLGAGRAHQNLAVS